MATAEQIERRKAVRMKPIADLPAKVSTVLVGQDIQLGVVNVAISGMALDLNSLGTPKVSDEIAVRLDLDRYGQHEAKAVIRHLDKMGAGIGGVQFVDMSESLTKALRGYVAELLERGAPS